jgi:hypothetical protein
MTARARKTAREISTSDTEKTERARNAKERINSQEKKNGKQNNIKQS